MFQVGPSLHMPHNIRAVSPLNSTNYLKPKRFKGSRTMALHMSAVLDNVDNEAGSLSKIKEKLEKDLKNSEIKEIQQPDGDHTTYYKDFMEVLMSDQFGDQGIEKSINETHSQNFYALIRHGERADNIDMEARAKLGIEIHDINDPPLTPLGL